MLGCWGATVHGALPAPHPGVALVWGQLLHPICAEQEWVGGPVPVVAFLQA